MSTYSTAEAALLTLIRAYSGGTVFDEANSSADDWLALDANGTEVAAVVEMAGPTTEATIDADSYGAYGEYQEMHTISLWLCRKRGVGADGDGAVKAALKALTEAVKDYLRPYRRLNGAAGVRSMRLLRTTEPAYISPTDKVEDATHVAQQIVVQVLCESAAPEGEMDG
jgi:hypothetical protein